MTRDPDPRFWPDLDKLEHAVKMAEKTIDRCPEIAAVWLRSIDLIRARMENSTSYECVVQDHFGTKDELEVTQPKID